MTVASYAEPLVCDDLAEAVAALRERGLRLSTSRRLVLETLFASDGPVSAEHVSQRLKLDLSSVYRNLEMFERHGLVRHVHLGHGPGLYALLGRGEQEYLFCEHCGAVRALSPEKLDPIRASISERFGYQARFTHFAIVGTCPACTAQRAPSIDSRQTTQRGDQERMSEHDHEQPHLHEHEDASPHSHEHEHPDGSTHEHAHVGHDHQHVEHEHEHSHGHQVHSHPHVHQEGLEDQHEHRH